MFRSFIELSTKKMVPQLRNLSTQSYISPQPLTKDKALGVVYETLKENGVPEKESREMANKTFYDGHGLNIFRLYVLPKPLQNPVLEAISAAKMEIKANFPTR